MKNVRLVTNPGNQSAQLFRVASALVDVLFAVIILIRAGLLQHQAGICLAVPAAVA